MVKKYKINHIEYTYTEQSDLFPAKEKEVEKYIQRVVDEIPFYPYIGFIHFFTDERFILFMEKCFELKYSEEKTLNKIMFWLPRFFSYVVPEHYGFDENKKYINE